MKFTADGDETHPPPPWASNNIGAPGEGVRGGPGGGGGLSIENEPLISEEHTSELQSQR